MDPRQDGSRPPVTSYHGQLSTSYQGPPSTSHQGSPGGGSLNILSSILRSPHPSLQAVPGRILTETRPQGRAQPQLGDARLQGRGQSPIRIITSLPPSVSLSLSPKPGFSATRTPATLPPKKSISPSRTIYTVASSSPKISSALGPQTGQITVSSLVGHDQQQSKTAQGQEPSKISLGRLLSFNVQEQGRVSQNQLLIQRQQVQEPSRATQSKSQSLSHKNQGQQQTRLTQVSSQLLPQKGQEQGYTLIGQSNLQLQKGQGQEQIQTTHSQGHILSHLPYLSLTLNAQGSSQQDSLFQQFKPQTVIMSSRPTSMGSAGVPTHFLSKDRLSPVSTSAKSQQPKPAHQRSPTPPHVNTIRRTPSPAHMPVIVDSKAKVNIEYPNRTQAVNLVMRSAPHQSGNEAKLADTDYRYGDLLQSINRSQENIQSHLQGALSPITPAESVATKPWDSSLREPQGILYSRGLVPISGPAQSSSAVMLLSTTSINAAVRTAVTSIPTPAFCTPLVSVGFTPVVLPSQSQQSCSPHQSVGKPVSSPGALPFGVQQLYVNVHSSSGHTFHSQDISVTQPGPPNVTISTCNSIPSQDKPLQKLPRNPFTFPATPPALLTNERPAIGSVVPIGQSKLVLELSANIKRLQNSDEMPELSPNKVSTDYKIMVKDELEDDKDLIKIPNAYNMRLQTLANFPNNSAYRPTYRATSVAILKAKAGCITNSAKSLDLLRQNIQKCINKDINAVIQSYIDKYFKIGIENIKLNNGDSSVTDDILHTVCQQILEEAKNMYQIDVGRSSISPARELSDNVSENDSSGRRSVLGRRRHPSDTDSEASMRPNVYKKKKGRPYILNLTGRSTPSKLAIQQTKREGPKFDPERLTEDTMFVMGSKANKAMGFGATRGRLYMKHPELFKYSGDQDDKTWLYEHQHMPATGGKSYLIVLNDVRELALNDEYKDVPNINVEALKGFTVPLWMVEKMRIQMMAMRTDLPKQAKYRSRSATPNEAGHILEEIIDSDSPHKEPKDLPFASFCSPKQSDVMEASPTEDLDFLGSQGDTDGGSTNLSPFNMTGGFDDISYSQI